MARIRSVHPGIFTDEAWVSCQPLSRVLFIGLWTDADDQGLFEWKPLQIRMRLLPGDAADVGAMLDELASVDLVKAFEHGGKKFGAIRNFRKHQRPKKPNAIHFLPSELRKYVAIDGVSPEPDEAEATPVPNQFPTGGEISPQMEDGGGRMEEEELSEAIASSGSVSAIAARPESEKPPPNSRGTRMPPDWAPGFAEIEYAGTKGLDHEEITRVAEDFRDYWIAKPGADGRKADWTATWQRWVRSHIDRRRPVASRPGQPRGGGQGATDFASIVAQRRGFDGA